MPTKLQQVHDHLIGTSASVYAELKAEFDRLMLTNPKAALSPVLGFAGEKGKLGPDGYCPTAAVKYLAEPEPFLRRFYPMLPFFAGLNKVYEIGVGPGWFFVMLQDVLGIDVEGCDYEINRKAVFREMQKALNIDGKVKEFRVEARKKIPIPAGTEAVFAFHTVFNRKWGPAEHEWFLAECGRRLTGPKLVILRLNPQGFSDNPEVQAFYQRRAAFPTNDPCFCTIDV